MSQASDHQHPGSRENLVTLESEFIATLTKQGIESFMKVLFMDDKVQHVVFYSQHKFQLKVRSFLNLC